MPDEIKLKAAIDAYAAQAHGSHSDDGELSRQRALALDAYAGKSLDEAPEGRSEVVDWAAFETVQWIMPSMMRIFAGGDNVVEFDPTGPEDEEVAEQESDYLNYLVTQKNDWELTVREWTQDALITKNAYCMAFMDETLEPEMESYIGQTEEQISLLLDDDVEVTGQRQYDDPEDDGKLIDPVTNQPLDPAQVPEEQIVAALAVYAASGEEPPVIKRQLFDVDIRRVTAKKSLQFKVLPPERCLIGQDTPDFTLEECDYFEYWELTTISDIRKMGHEIDDDIADDPYTETDEDSSRDEMYEADLERELPDKSMRQVVLRHVWIRFDYNEDGIAELQRVMMVGHTILERKETNRIPVACIVPFINTHRHIGTSAVDLVFDIARIKTQILRSSLDSLYLSLRPERLVSEQVNIDDMMTSRPGGIKRLMNGAIPGEGHLQDLVVPFVLPEGLAGLQHMDSVIESRVGVTRQFQGIDESASNDYNRIGQLSTMAAQRVEDIARVFGAGFKRLFSIAHELIIKAGHVNESIRLGGNWVDVDPTQWRTGRDMRVVAPFAAGNKDSLLQRLLILSQIHEKALAGGLPIVDVNDSYELALEIAKAADLPGTKFFTDPSTIPPQPEAPDHTLLAIEVQNKEVDLKAVDSERDAEIDKYKADLDAQVKQFQVQANSELQLALAAINNDKKVDLEKVKANLKLNPIEFDGEQIAVSDAFSASQQANDRMAEILAESIGQMSEAIRAANGPKKVIREGNKIVGVEPA